MKKHLLTATLAITTTLTLITSLDARPGKGGKGGGRGFNPDERAERLALREEERIDKIDTHKILKDPTSGDHRSENIRDYTNHTFKRIVALSARGAITEEQTNTFKDRHTEIVTFAKEEGINENPEVEKSTRKKLNQLNDDINAVVTKGDEGSKRTPLTNLAQHRFEEKIEFGERSGRLSKGVASRLRRDVDGLKKLEERLKAGAELTTREREKLIKEMMEVRREIEKELRD